MIEKITFENFRGFQKMELPELKPITLISGKNNTGKSSVLEGVFLILDHVAPDSFAKINRFRGNAFAADPVNLWESAFYQMDTCKTLRISMIHDGVPALLEYMRDDSFLPADDAGMTQEKINQVISSAKSMYTLKFRYHKKDYEEDGHFIVGTNGMTLRNMSTTLDYNQIAATQFTQFINAVNITGADESFIAEHLGRLELAGKKRQVVDILQLIDPAIRDLCTVAVNGQVRLFAKSGERLLPLRLAGDGINKLLFITLSIIANPHAILLIDEIETGFHYSMFPKLWETVARAACESDCQIIATTHSYECIVGAVDGMEKAQRQSDFCYYRLDKNGDGNFAYHYSGDLLQTAIATDMEVR